MRLALEVAIIQAYAERLTDMLRQAWAEGAAAAHPPTPDAVE